MPTFNDPRADATEAREAMRGLAHATRTIEDPREIYPVLGSLSAAAASLSQTLHQLAAFHDGPAPNTAWMTGDSLAARVSAYQVAWELHRAAEILGQVAGSIDHAHQTEASICYDHRDFPSLTGAPPRPADHALDHPRGPGSRGRGQGHGL